MNILDHVALWLGYVPKRELDKIQAESRVLRVAAQVQETRANNLDERLNTEIADMAKAVSGVVRVYEQDITAHRINRQSYAYVTEINYTLLSRIIGDLQIKRRSADYERVFDGLLSDIRQDFDTLLRIDRIEL